MQCRMNSDRWMIVSRLYHTRTALSTMQYMAEAEWRCRGVPYAQCVWTSSTIPPATDMIFHLRALNCVIQEIILSVLCAALDSDASTQFIFPTKRMSEANNELKTDFDMRPATRRVCGVHVEIHAHRDMASKVILIIVIYVQFSYSSAGRSMVIIILLLLCCYETTYV